MSGLSAVTVWGNKQGMFFDRCFYWEKQGEGGGIERNGKTALQLYANKGSMRKQNEQMPHGLPQKCPLKKEHFLGCCRR